MIKKALADDAGKTGGGWILEDFENINILANFFREDRAQRLHDITHICSLMSAEACPVCAEALCQVKTIGHLLYSPSFLSKGQ